MSLCRGPALKDTTALQVPPCPTNTPAPQAPLTRDSTHTAWLTVCHVLLDTTVRLWDCLSQQVRKRHIYSLLCFSFSLYLSSSFETFYWNSKKQALISYVLHSLWLDKLEGICKTSAWACFQYSDGGFTQIT